MREEGQGSSPSRAHVCMYPRGVSRREHMSPLTCTRLLLPGGFHSLWPRQKHQTPWSLSDATGLSPPLCACLDLLSSNMLPLISSPCVTAM